MKTKKSSILQQVLQETSGKEAKRARSRMLMAAKIEDAMKAKGWNKTDLLNAMGKDHPSIVTKWLSGTHNFTQDTLTDLGEVFGVSFLNTDLEEKEVKMVFTLEVSQETTNKETNEHSGIRKNRKMLRVKSGNWSSQPNFA